MFKNVFVFCFVVLFTIPLFSENPFGRALILSGARQYFEIPDMTPFMSDNTSLAIEVRFRPTTTRAYNLLNKWKYYPPDDTFLNHTIYKGNGWLIDMNRSSFMIAGKIEMRYHDPLDGFQAPGLLSVTRASASDGGYGVSKGEGAIDILLETWNHLAVIYDRHLLFIYLNGIESEKSSASGTVFLNPGYPLNIGGLAEAIEKTLDLPSYFIGQIDEVRIWNQTLTVDEINASMNDTLSADVYSSPESGLIGYYRFEALEDLGVENDGLANDVRDLSTSGNHGNVWNNAHLTEESGQTKVAENYDIPVACNLYQNFPNPFNPSTTIQFELPEAGPVNIAVYDIRGRLMSTLTNTRMQAGQHSITWASAAMPSGVYLCRMQSNSFDKTIKMVLQR